MKNFINSLRKLIGENLFGNKVLKMTNQMEVFFKPKDKILDLGAGTGLFTKLLKSRGFNVQPVDIKNYSYYPQINMYVYDGEHLPFKDKEFDVCLLISVLHHTQNPEKVLKEAVRVSKRLIIHENIVTNIIQRYYTYLVDCIMNKEIIQPHTNKTDEEWRVLFNKLGLDLTKVTDIKAWPLLHNKLFFLKRI